MEDTLNTYLMEHVGASVYFIILTLVGLIALSWWCRGVYDRMKVVDSLPCKDHTDKLNEQNVGIRKIDTALEYINRNLDNLNASIGTLKREEAFAESHSPLKITPKGEEMIDRVGMREMFEHNWGRVFTYIDTYVNESKTNNPYDIWDFIRQRTVVFPEIFVSKEELDKIKIDAYNQGRTLTDYMVVYAILCRDKYFELKGINVEDSDPEKKAEEQQ